MNTISECFIRYVIFGSHSTHRERFNILSLFLELINLLLLIYVDLYFDIQRLLMTSSETPETAHNC